jgi:hypothetical protein
MAGFLNIVIWYVGVNATEEYSASNCSIGYKVYCNWHRLLFSEYELVRSFKWVSYFNLRYVVDYDMEYVELNPILISE